MLPGRPLEVAGDGDSRGMTVLDRTRLTGRLLLFSRQSSKYSPLCSEYGSKGTDLPVHQFRLRLTAQGPSIDAAKADGSGVGDRRAPHTTAGYTGCPFLTHCMNYGGQATDR